METDFYVDGYCIGKVLILSSFRCVLQIRMVVHRGEYGSGRYCSHMLQQQQ